MVHYIILFDYKDPSAWPNLFLNSHRSYILKSRLNYNKNFNFIKRRKVYYTQLIFLESCCHTWLTYSISKKSLFCVPCKLFLHHLNKTNLSKLATDVFINLQKNFWTTKIQFSLEISLNKG